MSPVLSPLTEHLALFFWKREHPQVSNSKGGKDCESHLPAHPALIIFLQSMVWDQQQHHLGSFKK